MDTWRSVSTVRKEAQIVEDIMRYDFSKIAVLNSYEYVDTTAAARYWV
jgi:hypothetical protein